jgi:hypothetical protein
VVQIFRYIEGIAIGKWKESIRETKITQRASSRLRARPCPIISYLRRWTPGKPQTFTHLLSIPSFFRLYPLTGFSTLQLLVSKDMVGLEMPPLEHKVMARAVARVRAVGVLGIAPLEEPVPDRFCDSLHVEKHERKFHQANHQLT